LLTAGAAVTGVGALTPLGAGAQTLVRRWLAGERGYRHGLGECTEFDASSVLARKDARRTDRFAQLALAAAQEALEQAGWGDGAPYEPTRVACVIGTGIGGESTFEEQLAVHKQNGRAVSPLTVPRLMGNAAAAWIAQRHGLRGPSASIASACASGADAIAAAARLIATGEIDAAVAGGAESAMSPFIREAFATMGALSPSGVCRPFDARRDGFVLGEGAGVLVLEREDLARARGAPILGRVRGSAATSDAYHLTAPDPEGAPAAAAIELALRAASVEPDEVAYVNAHGTGTLLNDRAETAALKRALGAVAARIPVSSLKSATGHLLGAAGAVEAIATILALREGLLGPTIGYRAREEDLDLDYVPDTGRHLNGNGTAVALSSSFGFGGHNVVLVLEAIRAQA
jgi:3-oxoacyl-[acyl-carrier-protein] synthase II